MTCANGFSKSDAAAVRTMPSYRRSRTFESWGSSTGPRSLHLFECGGSEFAAVTVAEKVAEARERRRQPLSIRQALCRNGPGGRGGRGGRNGCDETTAASQSFQALLARALDARATRHSALSTGVVRRSEEEEKDATTTEPSEASEASETRETREVVGSSRVMQRSERERKKLHSKSQSDVTNKDDRGRGRRLFRALGRKGRRKRAPSPGRGGDQLVEQGCGRPVRRRSPSPARRSRKGDAGGGGRT